MLRSSGKESTHAVEYTARGAVEFDKYAKELFEWMDAKTLSRIRMKPQWQGVGGLPYVASVHHRATQCFKYEGNSKHDGGTEQKGITLGTRQTAFQGRCRVGSSGIETAQQAHCIDFA